jgi:hypothetical protein
MRQRAHRLLREWFEAKTTTFLPQKRLPEKRLQKDGVADWETIRDVFMIASAPPDRSGRYDRYNPQDRTRKNRFSGNCLFSFKRVMMMGWLASSNTGWEGRFLGSRGSSAIDFSRSTDSAPSEGKKAFEDEADKPTIPPQWLALAGGIDFFDGSGS